MEYWPISNLNSSFGCTGDIGEGGLLPYLPEEIEVGQDLRLKLFIGTEGELKSLEARVRVDWRDFHLGKREEYYRTRVKSIDLATEGLDKLKDFLHKLIIIKTTSEIEAPARRLSALGFSISKNEDSIC